MAFTPTYIQAQLLRAQRAMLIISDRIQSKFLYLQSSIYQDLRYKQRDIYVLWNALSDNYPYRGTLDTYDALINVLIAKCQDVDAFNSTYNTINPNYQDIGGNITILVNESDVLYNTEVVYPGDGVTSYTFAETIGNNALVAYRGPGTVLQPWSLAADNEHIQFNSYTGVFTPSYAFSEGESFWVQYTVTTTTWKN